MEMEDAYDLKTITADQILALPGAAKRRAIVNLADRRGGTIRELAKARPDVIAEICLEFALDDPFVYREEKISLLNALYMTYPDFNPEAAIQRLGDADHFVRREAMILLAPRKDFKEFTRSILESDSRQWKNHDAWYLAQGAAKWILKARTDDTINTDWIDAACVRALAGLDIRSIMWAFPAGLPDINESPYPYEYPAEDEGLADSLYRNCYIALMMTARSIEVPELAKRVRRQFSEASLRGVALHVFFSWQEKGTAENHPGVMLLSGCHMITRWDLEVFEKHIDRLAEKGCMGMVADALRALSLGDKRVAREALERIGGEHANPQVRQIAAYAREKAGWA